MTLIALSSSKERALTYAQAAHAAGWLDVEIEQTPKWIEVRGIAPCDEHELCEECNVRQVGDNPDYCDQCLAEKGCLQCGVRLRKDDPEYCERCLDGPPCPYCGALNSTARGRCESCGHHGALP